MRGTRRLYAIVVVLAALGGAGAAVAWIVSGTTSLFDRIDEVPRAPETRSAAKLAELRPERVLVPGMRLDSEVRGRGRDDGWRKVVRGSPGDVVQWLVRVKNEADTDLHDVALRTVLPRHVSLISGSVRLIDASQDTEQPDAPLVKGGVVIGTTFGPGGIRYVVFDTRLEGDFTGCVATVRILHRLSAESRPEKHVNMPSNTADVIIGKSRC